MAKRELIDKDNFWIDLQVQTPLSIAIRRNTVTELEIVKPYLEELKQAMKERDEDNGGEPLNAVDRGYHLAYEHLCKEIDKLLSEVEKKE